ncbi:hypothetical protein [Novosphingobium mathurense]|uniref:N-terminal domain of oxidoreductase n=1 Tax=Novosphingobium mathurense TaxID=428990 RepID=A0A1U6HSZ3_9SPHN|nr:hypothetical protein [Novosphingobium mathurense]SLJ98839.1 N-terminal domain of oxidoreductase [Novosphingobium mathurense]
MRNVTNRLWQVGKPNDDTAGGMALVRGHFERGEGDVPEVGEGQVLVRAEYFSPDAMNHAWVRGMPGKFDPLAPGTTMRGGDCRNGRRKPQCRLARRHARDRLPRLGGLFAQ